MSSPFDESGKSLKFFLFRVLLGSVFFAFFGSWFIRVFLLTVVVLVVSVHRCTVPNLTPRYVGTWNFFPDFRGVMAGAFFVGIDLPPERLIARRKLPEPDTKKVCFMSREGLSTFSAVSTSFSNVCHVSASGRSCESRAPKHRQHSRRRGATAGERRLPSGGRGTAA